MHIDPVKYLVLSCYLNDWICDELQKKGNVSIYNDTSQNICTHRIIKAVKNTECGDRYQKKRSSTDTINVSVLYYNS